MTGIRTAVRMALGALVVATALTGCSLQPTGVADGGEAPTGIAEGPTTYFIGADGELVARLRPVGGLGTISEALVWLIQIGPGGSELETDIPEIGIPVVGVTITGEVIDLTVPFDDYELTSLAFDQIVCTAIAVHVQRGGSTSAQVRVGVVHPNAESERLRTCPLIGAG